MASDEPARHRRVQPRRDARPRARPASSPTSRPMQDVYGWDESFPASSLEVLRSNKEANEYGTGGLYAVPGALSVLGVYYNKALVAAAGVIGRSGDRSPSSRTDLAAVAGRGDDAPERRRAAGRRLPALERPDQRTRRRGGLPRLGLWQVEARRSRRDGRRSRRRRRMIGLGRRGLHPRSPPTPPPTATPRRDFVNGKSAYLITGNWAASAIEKADGRRRRLLPPACKVPSGCRDGRVRRECRVLDLRPSRSTRTRRPPSSTSCRSPEAATVQFDDGLHAGQQRGGGRGDAACRADIADAFKSGRRATMASSPSPTSQRRT